MNFYAEAQLSVKCVRGIRISQVKSTSFAWRFPAPPTETNCLVCSCAPQAPESIQPAKALPFGAPCENVVQSPQLDRSWRNSSNMLRPRVDYRGGGLEERCCRDQVPKVFTQSTHDDQARTYTEWPGPAGEPTQPALTSARLTVHNETFAYGSGRCLRA